LEKLALRAVASNALSALRGGMGRRVGIELFSSIARDIVVCKRGQINIFLLQRNQNS
jgi:hypothetical protein